MDTPQIVILHGWGLSGNTFVPLAQVLIRHGFTVYTPDLPGFGESAQPSAAMSVSDYAGFLHDYLHREKIIRPVIIGHSFGGRVAIRYADSYPQNVHSLILTGTPGFKSAAQFKLTLAKLAAVTGNAFFSLPGLNRLKSYARTFLYKAIRVSDYTRSRGVMQETFKIVVDEDLRASMLGIRVPVVLIWGENDTMVPLTVAGRMQNVIAGSKLEVIPSEGHSLPYRNPEKFTEILLKHIPGSAEMHKAH